MGKFGKKKIKLCADDCHEWVQVGKCKDALGKHSCKYAPEGCDTCLTRFECFTRDNDTYRTRLTGIFYACKKCPAVKAVGEISSWETEKWNQITDVRTGAFYGMDLALSQKLQDRWKNKEKE